MDGEEKKLVGKIAHYYGKIGVAVVQLTDEIKVGDEISIEGAATNVRQKIESMQIEHEDIQTAKAGDDIGLKVVDKVRENDNVYKITTA
jgi:putative protease